MALDIPKELRLAPWRQSQGYSEEVTVERHVVHDVVTFERRVRVVSRFTPTIHPPALPHEKPPQPPPPTVHLPALPREKQPCVPPPPPSSRVPPPPPPPRRLEAGCKKAMAMASPARPKLMPATARAMLGLASPLPQPKLPPNPQHQEQPLGGEEKESGKEDGSPNYDDWKPKDSRKTTNVWSKSGNGNQYDAAHSVPMQLHEVKVLEPETEPPRMTDRSRSRAPPRITHRSTRINKEAKGTKHCRERRRRQRSRTASGSSMD